MPGDIPLRTLPGLDGVPGPRPSPEPHVAPPSTVHQIGSGIYKGGAAFVGGFVDLAKGVGGAIVGTGEFLGNTAYVATYGTEQEKQQYWDGIKTSVRDSANSVSDTIANLPNVPGAIKQQMMQEWADAGKNGTRAELVSNWATQGVLNLVPIGSIGKLGKASEVLRAGEKLEEGANLVAKGLKAEEALQTTAKVEKAAQLAGEGAEATAQGLSKAENALAKAEGKAKGKCPKKKSKKGKQSGRSGDASKSAPKGTATNTTKGATPSTTKGPGKYDVGPYNDLKGSNPGLDAHHVGQKALMKDFVEGYDPDSAPAILVPKVGHTIRGPNGIVSRSTDGINTARDLVARDIRELKRVYPDIPNAQLKKLVDMNKDMYPSAMRKK